MLKARFEAEDPKYFLPPGLMLIRRTQQANAWHVLSVAKGLARESIVPNEFRDCKRRPCHLWGSSGFPCHSRFFRTIRPGPGGRSSSINPGSETERVGDMRSAGLLAFRLHPAPDARADCVSRPTRRPRRELFLPRAFSYSWPGPILFFAARWGAVTKVGLYTLRGHE